MSPSEVDVLVARATGEAIERVQRLGFSLADPEDLLDLEPFAQRPNYVDWDAVDRQRLSLFP